MKRCTKCLLPETYANIEFDNNGICNVCRAKNVLPPYSEKDLINILNEEKEMARKQGRKYDCIIPFSGGKDSVFTLYIITKKYGMTPLVVTFNHLFFTDVIKRNQEKILNKIGADVVEFKPDWNIVKGLMLKSLEKSGDFCWHCHCGIYAYPMQIAVKFKIPLSIWGNSDFRMERDLGIKIDLEYFQKRVNLGIQPEEMIDENISIEDLQPFMLPDQKDYDAMDIRDIGLGDYLGWDVRKQVDLIKKELGWEESEVEGSFVKYDKIECKYVGIRDYLKFIKRGYGRTCQLASIDIRDGLMSRDEGLKLMRKFDGKRPDSLMPFLNDIGLSEDKFMDIALKHKDSIAKDPTITH